MTLFTLAFIVSIISIIGIILGLILIRRGKHMAKDGLITSGWIMLVLSVIGIATPILLFVGLILLSRIY